MVIDGGYPLTGEVEIGGGKNPALAVVAASLLCDETCVIENLPYVEDVRVMIELLESLGVKTERSGRTLAVDARSISGCAPPYELARKLRASSYLIGALLGKLGRAQVPYPGGCNIGKRGLDQHLKGMRALGARVDEAGDMIIARSARKLAGADIYMDKITVGGTINVLIAACRAQGLTVISNAAKEPHIVEVANFLNSMGARIKGAGTDVIRVQGVERLHETSYAIIPDQIETGTMMIAAAATRGDVTIRGCIPTHMEALTAKLLEAGVRVDDRDDVIRVRSNGAHRAIAIKTQVYPGFPTDLQQPMCSLLATARGTSTVTESIFDDRFRHLPELARMGARVRLNGSDAYIEGIPHLYGAAVTATDLRAGAAMVVAGLMAHGVTEIAEPHYIDRGYELITDKLNSLGARVRRVTEVADDSL
ncbi:MAG: UDP-N-acetylglucosamine 1-carboxyvinyltransferase [Oscillospiraceae bacterium]|nr:UDP-N-acetylglucosamine 1-carboxyvinyltransferase [Oscillospiraceae bacterium]